LFVAGTKKNNEWVPRVGWEEMRASAMTINSRFPTHKTVTSPKSKANLLVANAGWFVARFAGWLTVTVDKICWLADPNKGKAMLINFSHLMAPNWRVWWTFTPRRNDRLRANWNVAQIIEKLSFIKSTLNGYFVRATSFETNEREMHQFHRFLSKLFHFLSQLSCSFSSWSQQTRQTSLASNLFCVQKPRCSSSRQWMWAMNNILKLLAVAWCAAAAAQTINTSHQEVKREKDWNDLWIQWNEFEISIEWEA